MKRLLPLFLSLFLLAGCSGADTPVTQQLFAMNTTMTLTLYGSHASDAALSAQQAINRLDGLWSRTKASSDVSRLNAAAGDPAPETEVAPETGALLSRARELGALTGGALDITIAPIMDAGASAPPPFSRSRTSGCPPERSWTLFCPWWTAAGCTCPAPQRPRWPGWTAPAWPWIWARWPRAAPPTSLSPS